MRAAATLVATPPEPSGPEPPDADLVEHLVAVPHRVDQPCLAVKPGVGGEQPRGVGQHHEQRGPNQVRHKRGQPVVVTEPELVE